MNGVKRSVRVAERVRGELMNMLLRGEIRDPRVQRLVITRLTVTDDLQVARIYVRSQLSDVGDSSTQIIEALEHATGYIRREIGHRVKLKYTPQLRFYWDSEIDEAERVTMLLDEIRLAEADS